MDKAIHGRQCSVYVADGKTGNFQGSFGTKLEKGQSNAFYISIFQMGFSFPCHLEGHNNL